MDLKVQRDKLRTHLKRVRLYLKPHRSSTKQELSFAFINCFYISSWVHKVRSFNLLSLKSEVNGFIIMARSESCHT